MRELSFSLLCTLSFPHSSPRPTSTHRLILSPPNFLESPRNIHNHAIPNRATRIKKSVLLHIDGNTIRTPKYPKFPGDYEYVNLIAIALKTRQGWQKMTIGKYHFSCDEFQVAGCSPVTSYGNGMTFSHGFSIKLKPQPQSNRNFPSSRVQYVQQKRNISLVSQTKVPSLKLSVSDNSLPILSPSEARHHSLSGRQNHI